MYLGYLPLYVIEMFVEVIFIDFVDRVHMMGVQLPASVTTPDPNDPEKTEFHQLEVRNRVCDLRNVYTFTYLLL